MLVLPIRKQWFDMILSGEKKEEYRDVSAYWKTRFSNVFAMYPYSYLPVGGVQQPILFRNGYRKDSPSFVAMCSLEDIRQGKTEWGAELGKEYFVLRIHKVLDDTN